MNLNFPQAAELSASRLDNGERIEDWGLPVAQKRCEDSSHSKALRAKCVEGGCCFAKAFGVRRVFASLSSGKQSFIRGLTNILGNKIFALSVIIAVGIWLLVVPAFAGGLGANPSEKLLHQTGEIAIWTLGAVLSLSPLRVLFPHSRLVNALNRHRRMVGVSACVYGLFHFAFHLLYEGDTQAVARSFSKPFIWFGLAGLSILMILAATSNNFSIRKLGGKNWKRLHRLAYAAVALLIYHQSIAGKGHWHIARWLLLWLGTLQIARITKLLLSQSSRPFSTGRAITTPA